nr:DNA replication and repair protein RecF [Marinicella rhabdoformis]
MKLSAFRCFEQADFQFSPHINVLSGVNGVGKTSILEGIHFLSTGKSFRSAKASNLIKKGENTFTLFAHFTQDNNTHSLGCQFNKPSHKILKLNNQLVKKQTDITSLLPVLSIDPNSYLFCDNSPQFRRSFLDWMVFHVKHDYLISWTKVLRCQKHINQLLKTKQTKELPLWLEQYCALSVDLNNQRLDVFKLFNSFFSSLCHQLIPKMPVTTLEFYPGWSDQYSLTEMLNLDWDKNLMYGQLRHGVHRMDIQIKSQNTLVKNIYSRGQKKMISLICYLSCLQVMDSISSNQSVLCLDDFDAELDHDNAAHFFDYLISLPNQILISTVEPNRYSDKKVDMFHVKHC